MKKLLQPCALILLFIFLLLFPTETLDASKSGLLLWFDTLLPTLLPFLIISQLILKSSVVIVIQKMIGPLCKYIFHCSENGAFCMLCGFLCGYPVGARLISLQIKEHHLSLSEGQYLLAFCNNVSPMFCISYGITYAIGSLEILPFLCIIYGSALLFGFFTRPPYIETSQLSAKKQTPQTESLFQLIDVCIIDSFLILIKLCGYLILFSIISRGILLLIPLKSPLIAASVTSLLEITNGLALTGQLPEDLWRSLLGIFALTFGGLCCIFQTNSVISDTGLSLKKYLCHKFLITAIALLLFFLWYFLNRGAINAWR